MVDGQLTGSIEIKTETTTEPFFEVPSAQTIDIELQPEPDFVFQEIPDLDVPERTFALDIETTDLNPWDGRIISIGVLDLNEAKPEPIIFIGENERNTLEQFLAWIAGKGFTREVVFDGAFDLRWIYAQAMRHRIPIVEYLEPEIYDMGQVLQQVFQKFVFGRNKQGTLDQWGKHLLGFGKNGTIKELFEAWEKRDFNFIISYNSNDLLLVAQLYLLDQFVKGKILEMPSASPTIVATPNLGSENPGNPAAPSSKSRRINCEVCNQEAEIPADARRFACEVCNQERTVPGL